MDVCILVAASGMMDLAGNAGTGSASDTWLQNHSPTATVSLNTSTPKTNDMLTATATMADADGDAVNLTYVWKVNGEVRRTTVTSNLTDSFDLSQAGNGDKGQQIVVEVTPHDGLASGATVTASAIVANSAPSATVSLNTTTPEKHEILTATATKADADSDPVSLTFVWKVNGVIEQTFSSATALTDTFDLKAAKAKKDDIITVEITPNDGTLNGATVSAAATVVNGNGMQAAGGAVKSVGTLETLTQPMLAPIVHQAIARWHAAGIDPARLEAMSYVAFQIADLPDPYLGLAFPNVIIIDQNAAGYGWFIDPTPADDEEFGNTGEGSAQDRLDLLTVVEHEIGHLLGLEHDDSEEVMGESLPVGVRRGPAVNSYSRILPESGDAAAHDVVLSNLPFATRLLASAGLLSNRTGHKSKPLSATTLNPVAIHDLVFSEASPLKDFSALVDDLAGNLLRWRAERPLEDNRSETE